MSSFIPGYRVLVDLAGCTDSVLESARITVENTPHEIITCGGGRRAGASCRRRIGDCGQWRGGRTIGTTRCNRYERNDTG